MFQKIDLKKNINELEEEILEFWNKEEIFRRSVEEKSKDQIFFFYDGPPFATGLPHYGHILAGTIKDVIPRYQTMLGKRVERRFGWDCHGLPVEFEVEKQEKLSGKKDIEAMGIANFNELCRSIVLRYTEEWKSTVRRMARWIDLENDYKTMDLDFMESVWWVCKTLWDKDLMYQSGKIVAYSPRLNTPLSNFEVSLGYRDVQDPSITVRFPLIDEENTSLLIWTTTPWTLPANCAVAVHPELQYNLIEFEGHRYYLCKAALERYFKDEEYQVIRTLPGKDLERKKYEPPFPYFSEYSDSAFFVLLSESVEDSAGTGLVHTAPAFGEDDFESGKKYDLPLILPINDSGEFTDETPDLAGLFFKDADSVVLKKLKEKKILFRSESVYHSYPFCWRSNAPLMYRWIPSWYVNVEKIKPIMLENNRSIHWQPEHIRDGRMGKWLENARDWAISRNRYWGTPIPVWICDSCDHRECMGSRADLEERSGKKLDDLHRHFVDDLTWKCSRCEGTMRRTPEVLDCWFESGAMPYCQSHYPFENREVFDQTFPADFISEGIDQTRGWFYTLLILGSALFEKPAFKNCIVSGMVLAEDGKKMAKSLKNYPDPSEMIQQFGADSIRLYMLGSAVIRAEELKFSQDRLQDTLRKVILPLLNSLNFFVTYAEVDRWEPSETTPVSENPLDRWILSKLQNLICEVRTALDRYDLNSSVAPFLLFIDRLTNWYIRRSRRRFWKSDETEDKNQAYATLYFVLREFSKLLAPFIPYVADMIFRALRQEKDPISVHLCDFPEFHKNWVNPQIEEEMDLAIRLVEMGRVLRTESKLKIRQPLSDITLISPDPKERKIMERLAGIVTEELNVKKVKIASDESDVVEYSCRPNLPVLGPKYGKKMKILGGLLKNLSDADLRGLLQSEEPLKLNANGETFTIGSEDLLIDRTPKAGLFVSSDRGLTIVLNQTLTPELEAEGFAREVVNKIQQMRKTEDLRVDQRISVAIGSSSEVKKMLDANLKYLENETLCEKVSFSENLPEGEEFSVGERHFSIAIAAL